MIIVAVAVFFGAFVYKYHVADEPERRCGITNLFRWDYSGEFADGVTFSVDKSDVQVDFTGLKGWKRVCLVSMYEESFYGFADEFPWHDPRFHQIGRWQCSAGNPDDAITVALVKADGATLARQLKFPERVRPRITSTYYEGGPGMEMILAAGYRQCADVERAVARCARIATGDPRTCYLLFPQDQRAE